MPSSPRLPLWFQQPVPSAKQVNVLKDFFNELHVNTVCQSSHCPNQGRCWERNTATFMILGHFCTRACRFCAVSSGMPKPVDVQEPLSVAMAIKKLGLDYVVVTSVTRDDLKDQGASVFVETIKQVRVLNPGIKIEVLVPDFLGQRKHVEQVALASPEVMAHNIETVRRLTPLLRPQADYKRSLSLLKMIKEINSGIVVKSGMMVGLGETFSEVKEAMQDLHLAGCDILTIGQYLAPSKTARHIPVERFVLPEEFEGYREKALAMGFKHVVSGPLVRSSYLAKEAYQECLEKVCV